MTRGLLAALLVLLGIVLLPLHAVAATVPMLFVYDVPVRPTTTMPVARPDTVQCEVEPASNDYNRSYVGYDPSNPPVVMGAAGVHAYDAVPELLEPRELGGDVIYGALAPTTAAEGVESAAVRRLATAGDTQFRTAGDALAEALERHGIDPSTVETTTMYGKNPNLIGPQGQPWEMVRGLNADGELIEFERHANGHFFGDANEFELPVAGHTDSEDLRPGDRSRKIS